MFTPDNFYNVMRENFCNDMHVMWTTRHHGDKNISSFIPYTHLPHSSDFFSLSVQPKFKSVWMYDQEPLFTDAFDVWQVVTEDQMDCPLMDRPYKFEPGQLLSLFHPTREWPIWCHSEPNSNEINHLFQSGCVPCYYWYHAMIAREWFRHWQYNHTLTVKDKSSCHYRFLMYARDFSGTRTYRGTILDALDAYKTCVYSNWTRQTIGSPSDSSVIDTDHANLAAIHLVAETLFDSPKLYLTEKIFKPMVMSQPFIVFGPPGTLALLRNYGFMTFSHVWSEDYDRETDPNKRMNCVLRLVLELCQMPQQTFQRLYQQSLFAIEHNRKRFYSQDFMTHCWQELNTNWTLARATCDEQKQSRPWGFTCDVAGKSPLVLQTHRRMFIKKLIKSLEDHVRSQLLATYPHLRDL